MASRGLLAAHPTHQEPLVQLFPAGSAAHSTAQPQQLPGSSAAAGSAAFYRRAHVPVTLAAPTPPARRAGALGMATFCIFGV